MKDFDETKAVLMDLLAEHGDEEAVEALRNLEWLKKVQRHRDCETAEALRDLRGPQETLRQSEAWVEEALMERERRIVDEICGTARDIDGNVVLPSNAADKMAMVHKLLVAGVLSNEQAKRLLVVP